MKIEIKSRFDSSKILVAGEYEGIKDCLEKNRGANLRGANLRGVDLEGADLRGVDLRGVDLEGANLEGVDLWGANLRGANLRGVDLEGADLEGADLRGAKNYTNSHDFAIEIIHRQPIKYFTDEEWSIFGKIMIHRLCWDTIRKEFGVKLLSILKKLSDLGFDEWEKYYVKVKHLARPVVESGQKRRG